MRSEAERRRPIAGTRTAAVTRASPSQKSRTPCRLRDKPRQAAARKRPHGYDAPDSLRHLAPFDRQQKFGKRLFFSTAGSRNGNPHAPKRHCKIKSACPVTLCGLPFRFYRALCRKKATHCADYPAYACFLRFKQFGRRQTYAAPVRIIEYGRDVAARHRHDSTDAQAAAACFRRLHQKNRGYACKPSTGGTSPVCSGEMNSAALERDSFPTVQREAVRRQVPQRRTDCRVGAGRTVRQSALSNGPSTKNGGEQAEACRLSPPRAFGRLRSQTKARNNPKKTDARHSRRTSGF